MQSSFSLHHKPTHLHKTTLTFFWLRTRTATTNTHSIDDLLFPSGWDFSPLVWRRTGWRATGVFTPTSTWSTPCFGSAGAIFISGGAWCCAAFEDCWTGEVVEMVVGFECPRSAASCVRGGMTDEDEDEDVDEEEDAAPSWFPALVTGEGAVLRTNSFKGDDFVGDEDWDPDVAGGAETWGFTITVFSCAFDFMPNFLTPGLEGGEMLLTATGFPPSLFPAGMLMTLVSVFFISPTLPSPWARPPGLCSTNWDDPVWGSLMASVLNNSLLFSEGFEESSTVLLPRRLRAEGMELVLLLSSSEETLEVLVWMGLEPSCLSEKGNRHGCAKLWAPVNNQCFYWTEVLHTFMHLVLCKEILLVDTEVINKAHTHIQVYTPDTVYAITTK